MTAAADDDLPCRRALLTAALGFALVDTKGQPAPKEVQLVREWLDNWKGIGHVVTGMARQDYDLELTRYDGRGWGRDVLHRQRGALTGGPHRERVGTDAVAGGPGGSLGGAHEARGKAADAGGGHHPPLTLCRPPDLLDPSRDVFRGQHPHHRVG